MIFQHWSWTHSMGIFFQLVASETRIIQALDFNSTAVISVQISDFKSCYQFEINHWHWIQVTWFRINHWHSIQVPWIVFHQLISNSLYLNPKSPSELHSITWFQVHLLEFESTVRKINSNLVIFILIHGLLFLSMVFCIFPLMLHSGDSASCFPTIITG